MSVECERVGGINLSQGVCDTPVPPQIAAAVAEGVSLGFNSYTRHDGIEQLRKAIADKVAAFNGLAADPETNVVVSAGSTARSTARAWRCSIPATASCCSSRTTAIT